MTRKIDATRPLYAVVGAGDLAVEYARNATADVQARFAKIELEPKALRDQARTVVTARIDGLTTDAKEARSTVESRAKEARETVESRVKEARTTAETRAKEARTQFETYVNEAVSEVTETYGELAVRGKDLVARIRRQQATQDAKAATKSTVAKAKTAKTQTKKSAKGTAGTAKAASKSTADSAKKTAGTAKRATKSTSTSAKNAASATTKAAGDAAEKVGD